MGLREEPLNLADGGDWPKRTLDLPFWRDDTLHMVENVDDLRVALRQMGTSVSEFRELPAYRLALASGAYPWLADLKSESRL